MGAWEAFGVAFGLVFVAELGDKTQFAVLALAARGRPVRVALEAAAAFVLLSAVAVLVGAALAEALPLRWLALAGGVLFLVLGVLALRGEDEGEVPQGGAFVTVLVAELGDKTQIALAALAATSGRPVATGLGGALALITSAALAAAAGGWLQDRVPGRALRLAAAAVFMVAGVVTLLVAW